MRYNYSFSEVDKMAFQMSTVLLLLWKAYFQLHFPCLNIKIHRGVAEYRPLKKVEILDFGRPFGPSHLLYLTMCEISVFSVC